MARAPKPTATLALTAERAPLLAALGQVAGIVERRNTIPILQNVLVHVAEDGIRFTANDLDMEASAYCRAQVTATGSVTVPAALLEGLVKNLPEGAEISLTLEGDSRLQVASGRSRYQLPVLPAADFPAFPHAGEGARHATLSRLTLKRLLAVTAPFISTEETRYYLNGVYLHPSPDGALRAVATDGARLALADTPLPEGFEDAPAVILPKKLVAELRDLCAVDGDDVEVSLSASQARFTSGQLEIASKLIEGNFPDYTRVVPRPSDEPATVAVAPLLAAIRRAMLLSQDKSRAVRLAFAPELLTISARNEDAAAGEEEVPIDWSGAPAEFGFNAAYLRDLLGLIGHANVEIHVGGPNDAFLFTDPADADARFVLMPLRV